MNPPSELGKAGRALWRQLFRDFDLTGNEAIIRELCLCADRLEDVRERMKKATATDYLKLGNLEAKVAGSFSRYWRLAGLHAVEMPKRGSHA